MNKSLWYSICYQTLSAFLCAFTSVELVISPHFKHFQTSLPLFEMDKNVKACLEYWCTSRRHLHRGLQASLGKAPSLLNNFRNLKHFSKTRELQHLICLVYSCIRIKGRHLHAFVSKSKDVLNEIVPDRGKFCYSEDSEINTTNPFLLKYFPSRLTLWICTILHTW